MMNTRYKTITVVKKPSCIILLGSAFFAIFGLYIVIVTFQSFMYLDLIITTIGLFPIIIGTTLFFDEIIYYKQITFSTQKIIIQHQFKAIQHHLEENTIYNISLTAKGNEPIITVKGKHYYFDIYKTNYTNYTEVETYIKENYRLDTTLKITKTISEQIFRFFLTGLGIGLILFVIYSKCFNNTTTPDTLAYIEVKMAQKPIVHKQSRSKPSLRIYSVAYPEFKFIADNHFVKLAQIIEKGDVIKIGVKTEILEAKLYKTRPPTFGEKHLSWSIIRVQSIKFKGQVYQKTTTEIKDSYIIWIILLFGILLIWFRNI